MKAKYTIRIEVDGIKDRAEAEAIGHGMQAKAVEYAEQAGEPGQERSEVKAGTFTISATERFVVDTEGKLAEIAKQAGGYNPND